MKHIEKILLLTIFLFFFISYSINIKAKKTTSCTNTCNNRCKKSCLGPCDGYPFLLPRSQGRNAARDLIGWQEFLHKHDMQSINGAFAITMEYNRSMNTDKITQFYFGDQMASCNTILIQGSGVQSRNQKAWIADYFGLPKDFKSEVHFDPVIDNFMVDLNLHIGLDDFWEGGYIKIHSPLTHTKWNLNMEECIRDIGTNPVSFEPGYMSAEYITRDKLPMAFSQVMLGQTICSSCEDQITPAPITFGDMQNPMCYGKMPICPLTKTMLADIQTTLGWCRSKENYHVGVFINGVFPTGTRPNAYYLFEPIIGNGKHYELGFGISASWIFWESEIHEDRYLGLWFDATFNHMFKTCQRRSFDFCNKPNSRYMLLEEFGKADGKLKSATEASKYQYKSNLTPAINLSTLVVKSEIKLQTDLAFKFGYVRDNWSFDIGYNFWARTGECFSCIPNIEQNKYAIKGNAWLYGQAVALLNPLTIFYPIALSNTKNNATINCERTLDNPEAGFYDVDVPGVGIITAPISQIGNPTNELDISMPPVFIKQSDINTCKSPSAITHKIFLHFSYAWKEQCQERWLPFIGLGGSIELDHTGGDCCDCCDYNKCKKRAGLSQWGAWVKGGISFD